MRRWWKAAAIAAIAVTASGAGEASAAVRYASPSGSGGACTAADPCRLRTAIEAPAVMTGDQVVVMPGTYDLGANRILIDDGIRVHGQVGSPRPKVTSRADPMTLYVAHRRAVVSDLEISNARASGDAVWIANGMLERVFAHGGRAGCFLSPFEDSQAPLVRDSFCWGRRAGSGYGVFWAIGGAPLSMDARLRGVTAVGGLSGVSVHAGGGPVQLDLDAVNVIAQGGTSQDVEGVATEGGSVRAIFRRSNYDTRSVFASGGGTATATLPGFGANQTEPPVFVNPALGNFHQRRTSPTVDAGIDTRLNGPRDIDRQARSMGPAPDIGGDEIPPPRYAPAAGR